MGTQLSSKTGIHISHLILTCELEAEELGGLVLSMT